MSTQRKPGPENESQPLTAEAVESYLRTHPEFFVDHGSLLAILRVPHHCGGAVSLVEHQVRVLRDQNRQFKRKLMELVQVGRDNDRLNRQLHRLTLDLLDAQSLDMAVEVLHEQLHGGFRAQAVAMWLFDLSDPFVAGGLANRVDRDDPVLSEFEAFFRIGRPQCGRLSEPQLEFLFGEQASRIGSAALVPIGDHGARGMLAIASEDANHFHRTADTQFLQHLGELVGHAVGRFLPPARAAAS